MTISNDKVNLALARKQTTVTSICKQAGISRNRFYVILNSKKVAPVTAGKIASALGVDVTEILED